MDDTELSGAVDAVEGRCAFQRKLYRLEKCARIKHMKFNRAKCTVLRLGCPEHQHRLGNKWIESSPEEKVLGLLADEKLNINQQCTLAI